MNSVCRNALASTALLAALAASGCAELSATGNASTCTDATNWFERQRQLVDGHADPYAASIDAPCRVTKPTTGRGSVVEPDARQAA